MVTATGWPFAEVRASSCLDIWNLWRYWADHPPVHLLVAQGFGGGVQIKRRPKRVRGDVSAADFAGAISNQTRARSQLPQSVQDWYAEMAAKKPN